MHRIAQIGRVRRSARPAFHARRRCSSANIHDTFSRQYIQWPRDAGRDRDRQGHRASLWPKSHFTTRCTRRPGANKFHDCPPRRPCGSGAGGRDDREASGEPYYASRPLARAVPSTDFRIPDDPQFRICGWPVTSVTTFQVTRSYTSSSHGSPSTLMAGSPCRSPRPKYSSNYHPLLLTPAALDDRIESGPW